MRTKELTNRGWGTPIPTLGCCWPFPRPPSFPTHELAAAGSSSTATKSQLLNDVPPQSPMNFAAWLPKSPWVPSTGASAVRHWLPQSRPTSPLKAAKPSTPKR